MIGDAASAPPRADLTFLRRRVRPRPPMPVTPSVPSSSLSTPSTPSTPSAPPGPSAPPVHGIDYTRRSRSTPTAASTPPAPPASPTPRTASAPAAPSRPTIDFSRPGRHPAAAAAPPAAAGSSSLDLSAPSAAPSSPVAARPSRPAVPPLRVHRDARVTGREQRLLNVQNPTVTLTRVQSGVGHLSIEAVCSAEIGDLRLGAVYQLRSGGTSTVQHAGGSRFAPSARRPVIVGARDEYERLGIDLRQVRDIERIGIYAFSESRAELQWGGTLVVTTFGGARVELPMETLYPGSIAMLISLYNLDGELVIRAEMETIVGDVREAARAYGYDHITWRDGRTPVD